MGFETGYLWERFRERGIADINRLGEMLSRPMLNSYDPNFARGLTSPFYQGLQNGDCGESGIRYYQAVTDCLNRHRLRGFCWQNLWRMLVTCRHLSNNYNGSFSYFLKRKYASFLGREEITDEEFLAISPEDWESFKANTEPWDELYGIGEDIFNYITRDICRNENGNWVRTEFPRNSYKLDSANKHFLKVTGMYHLIGSGNIDIVSDREAVVEFLKGLNTGFELRDIGKAFYTYCSNTEAEKFGFCRNPERCSKCGVNNICERNI